MISPDTNTVLSEVRLLMGRSGADMTFDRALEVVRVAILAQTYDTLADINFKLGNTQMTANDLMNMVRNTEYKIDGIVNGVNGIAGGIYELNQALKAPPENT
jgi:hypothetical protein